MISWIQNTFQHHFKTVFAVLLAIMVISLVGVINQSGGFGRDGRRISKREFFGHNLAAAADDHRMRVDMQISIYLQQGFMAPVDHPQVALMARDRIAALALADRYHIAGPSQEELTHFITTCRAFQNEQGAFDPKRYAAFGDQIKTNSNFNAGDVARVMEEEYRIKRITELIAGPGYVLPSLITTRLNQLSTQWTLHVAEFDPQAFTPEIKPSEETLSAYFDRNVGSYEIGPQARVDYVLFSSPNFITHEPLNEADVVAYFEANRTRFTKPSADPAKPAVASTDLASVRPEVELALRTQNAARAAAKAASDFTYALYDEKITKDSPAIDALVSRYHGQRASAPLFTEDAPPAGLAWSEQVVSEAFKLTDQRYYSDPLPTGSDQVVLLWRETLPSAKPVFAAVREKVLANYVAEERHRLLTEAGRQWKADLEAKLAAGTSFEAAVAALHGAPKAEIKTVGPFTLRQPPQGVSPQVLKSLDRLDAGRVSDFLLGQKAYLVQVAEKKAPVIDPASPDYNSARESLAGYAANAAQSLVLSEMVENELKRSEAAQP